MCVLCQASGLVYGSASGSSDGGGSKPITGSFVTSTGKWGPTGSFGTSGGVVTWSLAGVGLANQSYFSDFFTGLTVNPAVALGFDPAPILRQAFDAWSRAANITFVQTTDGGGAIGVGESADIRISMARIDGDSGTLGKAYFPSNGGTANQDASGGDIVFDSTEINYWTASTFYLVALHEIGHSLGLDHETAVTAIMNPFINASLAGTGPLANGLQQDDIDGIRAIYGLQDNAVETWEMEAGRADVTFLGTGALRVLGNGLANTIRGAAGAETILGGLGADTVFGGAGNDVLVGDFEAAGASGIQLGSGSYTKTSGQTNGSIAGAVNISALFSLAANANIVDATLVPHVTISGSATAGAPQTDFYAVNISHAGSVITLDIDLTTSGYDSYLVVRNGAGAILAQNDDSSVSAGAGGSTASQDSFLTFTAPTAGVYFIEVARYLSSPAIGFAALNAGQGYTLQVSVAGELSVGGGNDVLLGEDGNDVLRGGEGLDTLYGWTGADTLLGDAGADQLFGEQDNDQLYGWLGGDTLRGGLGDDLIYGEGENDLLGGDEGNDLSFGGAGFDTLWGWTGNDTLWGGADNDQAYGDDGFDRLYGEDGRDTLYGGSGDDQLYGWTGGDLLWGGEGNDFVRGEQDDDVLIGEGGDDVLLGDEGADRLYGWTGADSLYGWLGNDELFGEQGADLIRGEDGDDVIAGGLGSDTMTGGAGADRFFTAGFEMAAGDIDRITAWDAADRYLFSTGTAVTYVGIAGGAAINVNVAGGLYILDVVGATTAQLQAQTLFF
jgi:Ca2+-binding RTX toxin-like protein